MAKAARAAGVIGPPPRARKPSPQVQTRANDVVTRLAVANPDPHVELHFQNAWQLMVAVILSAQSTDKGVNRVMPELLKRWPTPHALASADPSKVEEVIKPTGFFRNKTKSIRGASQLLVERFGGQVPQTMDAMLELPGVARKSANVVLGAAYGIPSGIAVDTHAMRVSQRLKLTKHTTPERIEIDLCALFPQDKWIRMGHRIVLHGRYVCLARKPLCRRCPLQEICPSAEEDPEGTWKERAGRIHAEMESRAQGFSRAQAT